MRWKTAPLIAVVCLTVMAPTCGKGTFSTEMGVSGGIDETTTHIHGRYEYDGSKGPANVVGDLQWKPSSTALKWTDEGDPTAARSDGGKVSGDTRARIAKGVWRLKVTLHNADTGAKLGHWFSPTRWVSHGE